MSFDSGSTVAPIAPFAGTRFIYFDALQPEIGLQLELSEDRRVPLRYGGWTLFADP
jgi:hypothetical protein